MSAIAMATLVIAACLVGSASGQIISTGGCPSHPTQSGFDLSQYMGTWYEQRKFFAIFEALQDCVKAEYTLNEDNTVTVVNSGVIRSRWFQRQVSIRGSAIVPDPSQPAELSVSFFGAPGSASNYEVVETDYTTYAVVFTCSSFYSITNSQFAWLLVRDRAGISEAKVEEIFGRLESYGIKTRHFASTNQNGCTN